MNSFASAQEEFWCTCKTFPINAHIICFVLFALQTNEIKTNIMFVYVMFKNKENKSSEASNREVDCMSGLHALYESMKQYNMILNIWIFVVWIMIILYC